MVSQQVAVAAAKLGAEIAKVVASTVKLKDLIADLLLFLWQLQNELFNPEPA